MSAIRGLLHRVRVLVDPEDYAREVEREIRFHLDREAMQKRGVGLEEQDAQDAARRQFGNVTYVREEVRRMTGIGWLDRLSQNLAYAVRGLKHSPGFTAAVVLTLGLGLGVNAAMFTFLDRVFVKTPPGVPNPGEVRRIYSGLVRKDEPNGRLYSTNVWYVQVREIRRAVDSTTRIGLFWDESDSVAVTAGARTLPAQLALANADYFRALGVRPQLGRLFDADEDRITSKAKVAVISDAMWKRVFESDPHIVGATFRINYDRITVIGVAPKGFAGIDLSRCDFWMPLGNLDVADRIGRTPWYETYQGGFSTVMRFPDAASERRFLDVASRIAAATKIAYWGDSTAELRAGPIQASMGPTRSTKEADIAIRLGGVALIILLITLANVSNLLLVRGTQREREISIRRALGVSRGRLLEQLLTESVLLAVIGGAVSMLLGVWAGAALRGLLLPRVRWASGLLDERLMAFGLVAALLTGIVVGVMPAIHAWRPDLVTSLRAGGKSGAYRRSHLRNGLLVVQAALSVVLLVGSGLFVRSLQNVRAIDLGFDYTNTHVVSVFADTGSLDTESAKAMPAILERAALLPGVESAAAGDGGPMLARSFSGLFLPGSDSLPLVFGQRGASRKSVTHGYFRTIGQRLIQGRDFARGDAPSIIVEEAMGKAYWPGESPLGKCLILGDTKADPCLPVIGVAEDTHSYGIVNDRPVATFYTNVGQTPTLILRFAPGRLAALAPVISAEVKRLLPRAVFVRTWPLGRYFDRELRPWRLGATLFTAMGVLALIVASVGVYSVIAYATSQRTNEMGIRVALGARMADIATLVIGDGVRTVVIGILVGLGLAFAGGKLVASLLYGISPRDPTIMMGAAVILAIIGIAACVVPALRASRVDPVTALRAD